MNTNSDYFNVNRIALLAILTAFITVGRIGFALPFLPNVQPMTALLILITLNIGVIDGLVVSVLSMLLTNLMISTGPWTLFQMLSFAILILITGILKYFYSFGTLRNRIFFGIWALLSGYLYGFIISVLTYYLYGMSNFVVYYLNGLPFDTLHGVGNLIFFIILEPILVPIIRKKFTNIL